MKLFNKNLILTIVLVSVAVSSYAQSTLKKDEKVKTEANVMQKTKIKMSIEGMSCMGCVANVKNTIEELEGVEEVEVSLEEKQAIVTYLASKVEPEKIQEAVNKKGFKAGKPEKEKMQ